MRSIGFVAALLVSGATVAQAQFGALSAGAGVAAGATVGGALPTITAPAAPRAQAPAQPAAPRADRGSLTRGIELTAEQRTQVDAAMHRYDERMNSLEASAVTGAQASASAGQDAGRAGTERARRDTKKGTDPARRDAGARREQAQSELYADVRSALTVEQQARFDANLRAQGQVASQAGSR